MIVDKEFSILTLSITKGYYSKNCFMGNKVAIKWLKKFLKEL